MLARLATNLRHRQIHGDAMGDGTTVVVDQNCAVSFFLFCLFVSCFWAGLTDGM